MGNPWAHPAATGARTESAYSGEWARRILRSWVSTICISTICIAQQTLAHYEAGKLRVAAAMLPTLSKTLGISIEELIGEAPKPSSKRGPAPRIQQQLELIARLPRAKQRFVSRVLDSMLAEAGR